MIKNTLIIMLIFSIQMSHVNAMAGLKETIERLGDHASADWNDDQQGRPALATVSLDSPANKRKINAEAIDPITRKTQQSTIEQEHVIKFNLFFQAFKNEADVIWKSRLSTKDRIIKEYVSSVGQADFDNNKHIHAYNAQVKIDEYYMQQYEALYKQLYLAHYKAAAPEEVAQYYASQSYSNQKSEDCDCCVIL